MSRGILKSVQENKKVNEVNKSEANKARKIVKRNNKEGENGLKNIDSSKQKSCSQQSKVLEPQKKLNLNHGGGRRPPIKKKKFNETHKRFTSYLEIDIYNQLQYLKNKGQFDSITSTINAALYEYLIKYFNKKN